jgi:hypothetical protein
VQFYYEGGKARSTRSIDGDEQQMEEGGVSKREETRNVDDVALSTAIQLSIPLFWRYIRML